MKSQKYSGKIAGSGVRGYSGYGSTQRNVSVSSTSAQSESSLASRNLYGGDANGATPRSKRGRQPVNGTGIVVTPAAGSGSRYRFDGGGIRQSPVAMKVRADVETDRDGNGALDEPEKLEKIDRHRTSSSTAKSRSMVTSSSRAGQMPVGFTGTSTMSDSLPRIVVDAADTDSITAGQRRHSKPTSSAAGVDNSTLTTTTTTNSAYPTYDRRLSRSDRNAIAAELAYQTQLTDRRSPSRRERRSKDLLHRSYEQTYEGRMAAAADDEDRQRQHLLEKNRSHHRGGLGKIENTAADIVEDAIEKALEAIYGKRRQTTVTPAAAARTDGGQVSSSSLDSTTAVERTSMMQLNSGDTAREASASRVSRRSMNEIRAEEDETRKRKEVTYLTPYAENRRRSSSSPRLMTYDAGAAASRRVDRRSLDQRYGSSEWYGSDYYLSPIQSRRQRERKTYLVGSSRDLSGARLASGYASDTALFSPPSSLPRLQQQPSYAAAAAGPGGGVGWRSASADSDFSTTLEIKNTSRRLNSTEMDIRSLDRDVGRQRHHRPLTLTKGMVTRVVHGLLSEQNERGESAVDASPSSLQSGVARFASQHAPRGNGVTSPPPGVNVLSVPTVYTGSHLKQSTTAAIRPLDVDVVDRQLSPSTTMTTTSARQQQTAAFVSASPDDFDLSSAVRVRHATDRRVDLLVDPGRQQRQQPKVRVFGSGAVASSGGGGGSSSTVGLPAIAEYDFERRPTSSLSAVGYSAFSNEPIYVADLMGQEAEFRQQQQLMQWPSRRTHSLDDLRTATDADIVVGRSATPIYSSSSAAKANINMSSGQVLNLYMFGRPRSADAPSAGRQRLERPSELETVTRSIVFDEERKVRRRRKSPEPAMRVVVDDKQTQTGDTRLTRVEKTRGETTKRILATGRDTGTSTRIPTSSAAVQTETETSPVEEREPWIPMAAPVYQTLAEPEPPRRRRSKEPRTPSASNVVEQTVFVRPTIMETREMEMTGDVFAKRPSRPVTEVPVVAQRKPQLDSSHVDEFFAQESHQTGAEGDRVDDEPEEEELLETEVVEEKQQRIEMTIREDIEFSLLRSQGSSNKPLTAADDGDGNERRTNIEPWWIPPRYEAYVDRKKQKITQIKEIENKDDYSKKTDYGISSAVLSSPVAPDRKSVFVNDGRRRARDDDSRQNAAARGPFTVTSDVTIDAESNTWERKVDIPVMVEKAYVSPVLDIASGRFPYSTEGSSYDRSTSANRKSDFPLQHSPTDNVALVDWKKTVTIPDRWTAKTKSAEGSDAVDNLVGDKRFVTSYTRYISSPSPNVASWNRGGYSNDVDEPKSIALQSPTRSISVVSGNVRNDNDSSTDEQFRLRHQMQTSSFSPYESGRAYSTGGKNQGVYPKTKMTLPAASTTAGKSAAIYRSTAKQGGPVDKNDDEDDGDCLPDSLDHFDRMLSHLEREILTPTGDDDRQPTAMMSSSSDRETKATAGHVGNRPAAGNNWRTAAVPNVQLQSDKAVSLGKKAKPPPPPPPPPLKKSWKFETSRIAQQSQQQPGSRIDSSGANSQRRFRASYPEETKTRTQPKDAAEQQSQPTNEDLSRQQLPDGSYVSMNLMEQPLGDSTASGTAWDYGIRRRLDSGLNKNSPVSTPPAFVSSSWKSLERRQKPENKGSTQSHAHDPSADPSRRDPNGYETMITAL